MKFELEPMPNLLDAQKLASHGIDHRAIKSWFVPRYADICNVLNRLRDPTDQLDCSKSSGCGIDDDCTLDENCVVDSSAANGYRCGKYVQYSGETSMLSHLLEILQMPSAQQLLPMEPRSNAYFLLPTMVSKIHK